MIKTLTNSLRIIICGVLTVQLMGCGTIMYPERKGQKGGSIDAGVAILDGIGLLFFIIPGVIAFAIDFNNGTIYLPGTRRSSIDIKQVRFDAKHSSMASIRRIMKQQTGHDIALDQPGIKIAKLQSTNDMLMQFAKVQLDTQVDKIALLEKR